MKAEGKGERENPRLEIRTDLEGRNLGWGRGERKCGGEREIQREQERGGRRGGVAGSEMRMRREGGNREQEWVSP